ncbi:hypothetical protein B0A48_16544 [Cryoendolithus antarcticus]|uniref:Utp8 beta-propeller domain-containing protein n=1 Tax=Cryoendolithus antarcticus TaxID=1507870 RepID=A0A1V8SE19_9PEZI|nr:hypothetical protein B0A48_16544 [Cryoendolithus antarcticus]
MAATLEAPYAIASLPKPLDAIDGKTYAAPVYSYRNSRKRKRHEVVVGVDGESVSIYNVSSQALVASYALPPQTKLCCKPASVYAQRAGARSTLGETYVAIHEEGSNVRILCYSENQHSKTAFSTPTKREFALYKAPTHIEAIPALTTSSGDAEASPLNSNLLVCYHDGRMECISLNEGQVMWIHEADGSRKQPALYYGTSDLQTARKGFLKDRQDILAVLGSRDDSSMPLLYRMMKRKQETHFEIFRFRHAALQHAGSHTSGLERLEAIVLPTLPPSGQSDLAEWDFHPASGQLCRLHGGQLHIADLMDLSPTILHTLGDVSNPVISSVRVSSSTVLIVTSDDIILYDTTHGSVQAQLPDNVLPRLSQERKRKRDDEDLKSVVRAITSFNDIKVVIGLDGNELVATQLPATAKNNKRSGGAEFYLSEALRKAPSRSRKIPRTNGVCSIESASFAELSDDRLLPVESIVLALKETIASLDTLAPPPLRVITAAASSGNGLILDVTMSSEDMIMTDDGMPLTNGNVEHTYELETQAAEDELEAASETLQHGLEHRSTALRAIFARLRGFPISAVKIALRTHLSRDELVFLIQILRIELAEGGWTSRYVDVGNDEYASRIEVKDRQLGEEEGRSPSDQAVRQIGDLLNCTFDAIGMSGWLVGLNTLPEETAEILDAVRAEVSASLEGCLEAQTLGSQIVEVERCASLMPSSSKRRREAALTEDDAALPLNASVEKVKPDRRLGPQKKKSVYEIAREQDLRVGKYALERIRI